MNRNEIQIDFSASCIYDQNKMYTSYQFLIHSTDDKFMKYCDINNIQQFKQKCRGEIGINYIKTHDMQFVFVKINFKLKI